MELYDLDAFGKEHEDWMRHAAFDQIRKLHKGKDISIEQMMQEATALTNYFLNTAAKPVPEKKSAQVIQLSVVSKDNTPPVDKDAALKRFYQRYEEDNALAMTDAEWNEWVSKLPRDEFLAMIAVHNAREGGEA